MTGRSQTDISERLREALSASHRRLIRRDGFLRAGVLVPILTYAGPPRLLLTRRTEQVETHKGQVSFPGGVVDGADAGIVDTALREIEEELGIPPTAVRPIGLLDDLATPTGFVITPVVGVIAHKQFISPNADEVAECFEVPLEYLVKPENAIPEVRVVRGERLTGWRFEYDGRVIWGATAMIIQSLLRLLGPGHVAMA